MGQYVVQSAFACALLFWLLAYEPKVSTVTSLGLAGARAVAVLVTTGMGVIASEVTPEPVCWRC